MVRSKRGRDSGRDTRRAGLSGPARRQVSSPTPIPGLEGFNFAVQRRTGSVRETDVYLGLP